LDHLILLVQLEQPWLVDVGFGNGFLAPLPLRTGVYQQGFLSYQLEQQDEHRWYFHNHPQGALGYGFTLQPYHLPGFATRCHELQTSPTSGFVRRAVCHRFTSEGIVSLRGAVLQHYTPAGLAEEELDSLARYRAVLANTFGLDGRLADNLWDNVWQRHLAWKQTLSEADPGA
jgi:N-hydroxyarylamine O-acetyltransferase